MKKILIIFVALITILILGLLFFYPNLTINNPNNYELKLDGKAIGNKGVIRKTIWGKHIISYGDNLKLVTGSFAINEITLTKPKETKISKTELLKLSPGLESPEYDDNKIVYLGGRRLDYLLSFDITKEEFTDLSKTSLRGAKKVIWSENKKAVLLYLDEEAEVVSKEMESRNKIWLYEITENNLTPLDFSEAAFSGNEVIGITGNGELKKFNSGKYALINIRENGTLFNSKITATPSQILIWDSKEALLIENNKARKLSLGAIKEAKISSTGLIAMITTGKSKGIKIYDIQEKKEKVWPIEADALVWSGTKLFAGDSSRVWKVDSKEDTAVKIFENRELSIGSFFWGWSRKHFF